MRRFMGTCPPPCLETRHRNVSVAVASSCLLLGEEGGGGNRYNPIPPSFPIPRLPVRYLTEAVQLNKPILIFHGYTIYD
jgi:hypothetical protein